METKDKFLHKQNNRMVLSFLLSIMLAFCILPATSIKAFAGTNDSSYVYQQIYKTYVYNYMYGTYNNEYALGFQTYYGLIEQIDVVNANKGVTLSVKNYSYDNPFWLTSWISGLMQASVPEVIGMPTRVEKYIKYTPYRLSGKKLSATKYDKVVYFSSKQIKGKKGTVFFKAGKTKCAIDVYNNYGKKVQSINAKTTKQQTGNVEFQNGKIYLNVQSSWYVLKNGKFIKSKKPAPEYSYSNYYPLLQNETVYKSDDANESEYYQQWYLLNRDGSRIDLPLNGGASYVQVNGLGVYCIDKNKKCFIYNNKGKLLKTYTNVNSMDILTSVIPNVFVIYKNGKLQGAYNSSLRIITRTKSLAERYANCWLVGVYKNKKIYAVRFSDMQIRRNLICRYLKKDMKPLKIKNYSLVGKVNNTLSAPQNLSNQKAYVGMNSQGKFFLINSKGKKIISFSFTNFDVRENAKYALVANGRRWSFIPLQ